MIIDSNSRLQVARRLTAVCVLTSSLTGCLSEMSSSVRETPGAPLQRLRLVRAGVSPIAGHFQQEGHAIVGQLTPTVACNAETIQRVQRQQVTESRTHRRGAIGWLVAGGVIAAVGTGLLAASTDADERVTCGEQRDGDRCTSVAGAMTELGVTTLVTGLAAGAIGGLFLARKPEVAIKDLPEQEVTHVSSQAVACAATSSLEGIVVAVELPGNGSWSGRAAADGAVRIEVQPRVPMPEGTTVQVVVQSVPSTFASSVTAGSVLAEVTFQKEQRSSQQLSPSRKFARR